MLRAWLALFPLCFAAVAHAEEPQLLTPHVLVAPMKTSIYIGSVNLTTTEFVPQNECFAATYEARVWPWFFWNETGQITIKLPATDLTRLALGQTVEFTGEATNHRKKPRPVTGRAQPAGPTAGKIKVRIMADGIELIFNGSYRFEAALK